MTPLGHAAPLRRFFLLPDIDRFELVRHLIGNSGALFRRLRMTRVAKDLVANDETAHQDG